MSNFFSKKQAMKDTHDNLVMNIIFFVMCVSPVIASFFIATNGQTCIVDAFGIRFPLAGFCVFKAASGYNCPVCGMTRCFSYMSHGDFINAWHISHAGITVYLLCVFEAIYRLLRVVFGNAVYKRSVRIIEGILITVTCFAVAFFFIAQFFDKSLIV